MKIFFLFLMLSCSTTRSHDFKNVKVIDIYDGDTIKVEIPNVPAIFGKTISIRLKGIDTPEIRSKDVCEKRAAKTAKSIVLAKIRKTNKVTLSNCERGKYFRLVCNVSSQNQDLSKLLISKGYAYSYQGGTKQNINWCNYPKLEVK